MQPSGHKAMHKCHFFFRDNSHQDLVQGEQPNQAWEAKAKAGLHVHPPFIMINSSFTGQDVSIYLFGFFNY